MTWQKIEISHRTIIFTVFFVFLFWLIIQIRDILLLLFISFIIMSALRPLVDWLEKRFLPRVFAILILYVIGLSILGLTASTILPPLVSQSIRLANLLPGYISSFLDYLNLAHINLETFTSQLAPLTQHALRITLGIFNNIFATLSLLVFSFYFLLERKHLERYLTALLGKDTGQKALMIVMEVENRLGAWVRGQLFLMVIIGVSSYIGLTLLRVEFALPLSLIAGLLEIVPVIGPIASAIPAVIVALATSPSPFLALAVIGLYFIIQQLENNLIVPTVMKRAVGLPPVVTLIALMIGGRLGGIGGAILAIPLVVTLLVFLRQALPTTAKK